MVLCNCRGRKRGRKDIAIFISCHYGINTGFNFSLSSFFFFIFIIFYIFYFTTMTYVYYASATALLFFALYRPFITKLDTIKYIVLGSISFMIPYIISYNNNLFMTTETAIQSTNHTMYFTSPVTKNATFDQYTIYALIDSTVYFLISILTVSITGLLTRWQFPITFIRPRANVYISVLIRHGMSTLFVLLAILR